MANEFDFGMEKAELKQMLAKSKNEPLACAMGKGKDSNAAYLRLHKTKQPAKLRMELCADFNELKDPRWGTVFVDTDVDSKLVLFRINKPSSGLAKRLTKIVKKVGYSKVRFEFDDGSEAEEAHDDEEEGLEVQSEGQHPEPEPETLPEAITLKPRLADAVKAIVTSMSLSQTRKLELSDLAKTAQKLMAANDFAGTLAAIEELEIAIDAPAFGQPVMSPKAPDSPVAPTQSQTDTPKEPVQPQVNPATGAVAYAKSRLAWLAVRKQMQSDVDKLQKSLTEAYKDTPLLGQIQTSYQDRVNKKLERLDESLADLLDDASNAADPTVRADKVKLAREKIVEYQTMIASESKFFDDLDNNPFVPIAITATLTKTLTTLSAAVR